MKANRGADGADGQSIATIEARGVTSLLEELRADLLAHRYRPHPVQRVFIPKPGRPAEQRPLG